MKRIGAVLAMITACGALSYEPVSQEAMEPELPDDDSQDLLKLGAKGAVGGKIGSNGEQVGLDVVTAEARARAARSELEKIEAEESEEGIAQMSERQVDAQVRRAEAQLDTLMGEEGMIERVLDAYNAKGEVERDAKYEATLEAELGNMEKEIKATDSESKAFHGETEEFHVRGDGAESDIHQELKLEHRQDRAEEVEEHREAKLWKLATKKVENQMVKEKLYLHRRAMLEHETHQWLAQEAEAMRRTAATLGALGEGEILQMLDISKGDLDGMMIAMETFGRQGHDNMTGLWIEDKLAASRSKVEYASAKMLEAVKHKVETFKSMNPSDYDDRQFLVRLAHLLDDTRAEIGSVEEVKERERGRLENWDKADGEKLTYSLGLALQGVTGNVEFKSHLQRIDTARLAHVNMTDACGVLSDMVHSCMVPAYNSIHHQKETIDKMSRIPRAITANMPSHVQDTMANRTAAMLNMAYAHNLALKQVATVIVKEASPVVLSRLHCAISGAPQRRGLGLGFGVATVAAAVAWLVQ